MSWIGEWVQEKAAGYLKAGVQAGGTLAGNAVGGVGSMIEESGRSVGQGVTGGINSFGDYINGYGNNIKSSMSADGPVNSTAKRVPVKATSTPGRQPKPQLKPSTNVKSQPSSKSLQSSTARSVRPTTSGQATSLRGPTAVPRKTSTPAKARPPVSTSVSERASDGRVKISTASRPGHVVKQGQVRPATLNKPAVSTNQSRRSPDGKVIVSKASKPGPIKVR